MTDSRLKTLQILEERLTSLPEALRQAFEAVDRTFPDDTQGVLVTGGGMSEGPARLFVSLLRETNRTAFFVPLSEFVGVAPSGGDTLVLFSQGLAPNARFPLPHLKQYEHVWIVTSVSPDPQAPPGSGAKLLAHAQSEGAHCLVLPPADETGLLLRVVGPAVAALGGALLLKSTPRQRLQELPQRYREALSSPTEDLLIHDEPALIGLVTGGRYAEACGGLSWKLLEGLQVPTPPIWDLLQVVHGPFQSFCNRPQVLLVLEKENDRYGALLNQRLKDILTPPKHKMIQLSSSLPGALAWFDHDAQLNAKLLATLRKWPRDLLDWPGKNQDSPLYDLAPDNLETPRPQPVGPKLSPTADRRETRLKHEPRH